MDGPNAFGVSFVSVAFFDFVAEFIFEGLDDWLEFLVTCWWRFVGSSWWHFSLLLLCMMLRYRYECFNQAIWRTEFGEDGDVCDYLVLGCWLYLPGTYYVMRDAGCTLQKSLKKCIIMVVLLPLHVQGYRTPHNFN